MKISNVLFCAACLNLSALAAAGGEVVYSDATRDLRFELPAGYTAEEDQPPSTPGLPPTKVWLFTDPRTGAAEAILSLSRTDMSLPRLDDKAFLSRYERLKDQPVLSDVEVKLEKWPWRKMRISVVRATVTHAEDGPMLMLQALVPTQPQAVFFTMKSTPDKEALVRGHLKAVLGSLKGRASWARKPTTEQTITKWGARVFCYAVVLAVLAGAVKRLQKRRRCPGAPPEIPPQ